MTWLIRQITGAAGPYIAGAVLLVMLSLTGALGAQTWRLHSLQSTHAQAVAEWATDRLALEQTARAAEQRARDAENKAARDLADAKAKYDREQHDAKIKADSVIAGLHAGNLVLRERFRPARPGSGQGATTSGHTLGTGSPSGCGLSEADAGFFIGIADEADAVVRKYTLAQALLRQDRQVCPVE